MTERKPEAFGGALLSSPPERLRVRPVRHNNAGQSMLDVRRFDFSGMKDFLRKENKFDIYVNSYISVVTWMKNELTTVSDREREHLVEALIASDVAYVLCEGLGSSNTDIFTSVVIL